MQHSDPSARNAIKSQFGWRLPDVVSADEWSRLTTDMRLAPREADVLWCAISGDRIGDIATRLGLREGTIKTYRDRLFRKLGVNSATELVSIVGAAIMRSRSMTTSDG